jgi:flagellar biosynthesis component FlhA
MLGRCADFALGIVTAYSTALVSLLARHLVECQGGKGTTRELQGQSENQMRKKEEEKKEEEKKEEEKKEEEKKEEEKKEEVKKKKRKKRRRKEERSK